MNRIAKVLLKNRNFFLLWSGQIAEQFGDSLNLMALIAFVLSLPAKPGAHLHTTNMSILMMWLGIPILFIGPFAGVFVDRIKRKTMLLFAATGRGTLVLFMFLIIGNGKNESAPFVYILVFLISVVTQFFIPAKSSFIPRLVKKGELLLANSISATTTVIVQIFSYAIAGIIISEIGIRRTLFINVCTYIISVTTLIFIRTKENIKEKVKMKLKDVLGELKAGIKFLMGNNKIKFMARRVFALMLFVGFFYVSFTSEFLHTIIERTGLPLKDIKALGFMQACLGLGLVAGIFLIEHVVKRMKEITLIRLLFPLAGLGLVVLYITANYYYLLAMSFVCGIIGVMILSIAETALQKSTPENMRGRVFAAYYVLRNSGTVIASITTGMIVGFINEDLIVLISGLLLIAYGLFNFFNTSLNRIKTRIQIKPQSIDFYGKSTKNK